MGDYAMEQLARGGNFTQTLPLGPRNLTLAGPLIALVL